MGRLIFGWPWRAGLPAWERLRLCENFAGGTVGADAATTDSFVWGPEIACGPFRGTSLGLDEGTLGLPGAKVDGAGVDGEGETDGFVDGEVFD